MPQNLPLFDNPVSEHLVAFVIFFFALSFLFIWVFQRVNRSILSVFLCVTFLSWAFFMAAFLREPNFPLKWNLLIVYPIIGFFLLSVTSAITAVLVEKFHDWKVEDSFIFTGDRDRININFTMGLSVFILFLNSIVHKLPFVLFHSLFRSRIPGIGGFLANLLLLFMAILAGYLAARIIPWDVSQKDVIFGTVEKKVAPFLSVRGGASKVELILLVISFLFSMSMVIMATKVKKEAADYIGFFLFALIAVLYIRKEIIPVTPPAESQIQDRPEVKE